MMRSRTIPRHAIDDLEEAIELVGRLRPSTLVLDVEPLLVRWGSPLGVFLDAAAALRTAVTDHAPTVTDLVLASNARWPSPLPPTSLPPRTRVEASARKPWRTGYLGSLPRPIVVVGDQPLTDGLLAWRLRCDFLHSTGDVGAAPWLARTQAMAGRLVTPLLFTTAGSLEQE